MRNFLLTCILLLGFSVSVLAQETVEVTGIVTDENNEPLIGASVSVSNVAGLGVITDVDGKYKIKMPLYNTLIFTYIGFDKVEVLVKDQRVVNVTMKESDKSVLNEVVVTGTGVQKKIAITGAITNVDVEELKSNPSSSMANGLAGVVPGIMAMQADGRPGTTSEFWIRSISTFGGSNAALVLVDGFERDFNEVSVEDVESISVLKDASATAIYGSKGANGVILVTTKRGDEGKIRIDAKVEGFYSTLTKAPEFVDGYTYASMANEAKVTRNQDALYQPEELEILRLGLDRDLYPNEDWMDILLRDGAWKSRVSLNMRGGGKTARYFVSGSYQNEQGMYQVDKALKDYNTNSNFRQYTYRMNIDIDITKTTLLKASVSGSLRKQNDPGGGSNSIWTSLFGYNPVSAPRMYSNGYVPAITERGKPITPDDPNIDRFNPWTLATMTGYNESWTNNIQTSLVLEQNLNSITQGLFFTGRFGYDTENSNYINRIKFPEMYYATNRDPITNEITYTKIANEREMRQGSGAGGKRNEFVEAELHYDRRFSNHNVGGVLKYTQSSTIQTVNIGSDLKNGIARRNQGIAGRANYNWASRYFIDFNFGYTGSENFAKGKRFGFFPAISGAWIISEEPFMKGFTWMDMFKVRYSYGKAGRDALDGTRFPYLYTIETRWKRNSDGSIQTNNNNNVPVDPYNFGDYGYNRTYNGIYYRTVASSDVTWEVATKQDLGVDFSFFNNKVSGTVDYFHEKRTGIYMGRQYLPWSVGIGTDNLNIYPSANVGEVKAQGFDGNFAVKEKLGNVDVTLRGNMTYSKNEILAKDEEYSIYSYTQDKGHRVDQARGLIALGLFKDYEEIRNSPTQTFGEVMPGDIKYKDVNGDGIIDKYDRVAIGATTKPNLTYGFGVSTQWKGFNVSVHFQGVGKSTFQIKGSTVHMFSLGEGWGNILDDMAKLNRWQLGVNEDPNAEYPRLTYGANSNNYQESTFWLRDASYLRLKTLDIGYTLPTSLVNKLYLSNVRIFFIGTNLLTFSKFKLWDPEMGSSDGKKYPLSKTFSLGVSVSL